MRAAGVSRSTGYRWIYKRFNQLQRAGVTLRRCQTQLRLTDDRTRILEERRLLLPRAGDHIVSSANLCGGSITQLDVTLRRFGVETTFLRSSEPADYAAAITRTKLVAFRHLSFGAVRIEACSQHYPFSTCQTSTELRKRPEPSATG